jgi:hypothetical protein
MFDELRNYDLSFLDVVLALWFHFLKELLTEVCTDGRMPCLGPTQSSDSPGLACVAVLEGGDEAGFRVSSPESVIQ